MNRRPLVAVHLLLRPATGVGNVLCCRRVLLCAAAYPYETSGNCKFRPMKRPIGGLAGLAPINTGTGRGCHLRGNRSTPKTNMVCCVVLLVLLFVIAVYCRAELRCTATNRCCNNRCATLTSRLGPSS